MIKILTMAWYCFRQYRKYDNDITTGVRYVICLLSTCTRILISNILLQAKNIVIKTKNTTGIPQNGSKKLFKLTHKMSNKARGYIGVPVCHF
jgi:hypothetical protein